MANASHKGMGAKGDGSGAGDARSDGALGQADMPSDLMGRNKLQGDDQERVHNERQSVAGEKLEPDESPLDSADMLDKDARAEAELGKGRGVHPGKGGETA